jgi:HK97 family phage portal protein
LGLIRNLLFKNYSLADMDRDMEFMFSGTPTLSGVQVNEQTALRHITVLACVRVRAETFGSLPLSVYKRRKGKGEDEAYDHPVYDLLHAAPNPDMTPMTWKEAMNGHVDLSGNCYSIITTNRRGVVTELYPWDWHKIEPRRNMDTGKIEYRLMDRGKEVILPAEMVFHVPGFGFDGIKGYSIISQAREAVGMGMAISEFTSRFYGQGMNIGGVLETPNAMKKENVEDLRQAFMKQGAGLANSWLPIVLDNGLSYKRIPMPMEDAQTIEMLKLNDAQICGLMRVPPHMIANLDRSTNNNIEHQGIEYVVYSMLPLITRFEQAMNWKLFTPAERAAGYYVKFNVNALLRGDYKSRQEGLAIQRQNGIINANEWRELEEINPIDGPVGDVYLVNGNMMPADQSGQAQDRSHWTLNEKRLADGKPALPDGDAVFMPATQIPAVEVAEEGEEM